ncbi:hypothetical protein BGX31_003848 [Mortierella sp. GBA43]|nr:hypothetical protein BGX31_003848 [Mortierella sp. GBA43]
MDELPEINVHSYIGVIISISGNILIAVALNVQKYAHNQLQPGANSDAKLLHTSPTCIVEEEPNHNYYNGHHYQPLTGASVPIQDSNEGSQDLDNDGASTQSSQSSRRSSIHSDHNSDTSAQTETVTGTTRADSNGTYSADSSSEMLYLRSKAWWLGMTLMILGECGNFLAYGYAQASIIAPLGTVALVSNVIIAPLMLKEPFRKRDLLGIAISVLGTIVVVINSKENDIQSIDYEQLTPEAVVAALLRTRFVVYFIFCCVAVTILASLSNTIGHKYIFIDLSIVGIFGGYTVLATKGLSSLLSLSFYKMFTYPIAYLLVFVLVSTAVLQIKFLNKALQRFDSTQVIPTQYVLFTTSAIIGSGILYNDFDEMDFPSFFNFTVGCFMTFVGVYLITTNRDKTGLEQSDDATSEWAMASQAPFIPGHHHRRSGDSYTIGRGPHPLERNRTENLMEQGRAPTQSIGYVIPQGRPGRPTRHSLATEAIGSSTPLLGTSNRQSIAGSKDQLANITNAVAGSHHTTLLLDSTNVGGVSRVSQETVRNHDQGLDRDPVQPTVGVKD